MIARIHELQSLVGGCLLALTVPSAGAAQLPPIIDMHMHANPANAQGPPPVVVCAPYEDMPLRDPRASDARYAADTFKAVHCQHPVWSGRNDDEVREQSLAMLKRFNITAVVGGPFVERWHREGGNRVIPSLEFGMNDAPPIDRIRQLAKSGAICLLGEIGTQYEGIGPDDPRLEPYWAIAEELDLPVGIHMGPGPPGAAYLGAPAYRMSLGDPLLLESVLAKHPKLRIYVMHAGWPMIDHMIALMYEYPQVYVDTAVIDYTQPRAEFWGYLKRLVDAGYGRRIMYGSDQMVWPGSTPTSIKSITEAPFLTSEQKRDILYHNAVRFLRLGQTQEH